MPQPNEGLTGGGTPPPAAGNPPPAGGTPPPAGGNPPPGAGASWRDSLPEDLRGEASLATISDVGALAKSYVNAQKLIGKDKISVPDKHASDDDWKNIFTKLGNPSDIKEYNVDLPKDHGLADDFVEKFKGLMHENGVLPRQAKKLFAGYAAAAKEFATNSQQLQAQAVEEGTTKLKAEWGAAYPQKLRAAQVAFSEFADPDAVKFMNESGLAAHPVMLKLFDKVASSLAEDKIRGGGGRGGDPVMTPEAARAEHQRIMGDTAHPYWNPNHANHKAAVAEVAKLFGLAHPTLEK